MFSINNARPYGRMSLWKSESEKDGLSAQELAQSFGSVDFGPHLRFQADCTADRAEIVPFLLQHYDSNAPTLINWLLDHAVICTAIRSVKTGDVLAFMAGVSGLKRHF